VCIGALSIGLHGCLYGLWVPTGSVGIYRGCVYRAAWVPIGALDAYRAEWVPTGALGVHRQRGRL